MTPLLKFLEKASQTAVLHKIRREILGETTEVVISTEDNELEEGIEEEEEEKKKKKKTIVLKKQKRKQSPTLQQLVDKFNPDACDDSSTDFTCLLSFIDSSIGDFDFGKKAKNGNITWNNEAREMMSSYLEKCQRLFMFAQRNDVESVRGVFVKATRSHKRYILERYRRQPKIGHDIHENIWRKIMHADRSVVLNLMDKKAARERYRLENKYEISWSHITMTMRKYISYLEELDDNKFTSLHATSLEFLVECNAGPRKISVLDPIVKF